MAQFDVSLYGCSIDGVMPLTLQHADSIVELLCNIDMLVGGHRPAS